MASVVGDGLDWVLLVLAERARLGRVLVRCAQSTGTIGVREQLFELAVDREKNVLRPCIR